MVVPAVELQQVVVVELLQVVPVVLVVESPQVVPVVVVVVV